MASIRLHPPRNDRPVAITFVAVLLASLTVTVTVGLALPADAADAVRDTTGDSAGDIV